MYTLAKAITKTRRYLKDSSESVWTNNDIKDFINEGMLLIKRTIPEYFYDLVEVYDDAVIIQLEAYYKDMPCIYAASRCFEQDEQHYRATQKRNEFESQLEDMDSQIRGSIEYSDKIANPLNPYFDRMEMDYVRDVYYTNNLETDEILPLNP